MFSMNVFNNCGFVAMASLLSYYDTYYNDEIVDNEFSFGLGVVNDESIKTLAFNSNSPGSYDDYSILQKQSNFNTYYQAILDNENSSLLANLICFAIDLEYNFVNDGLYFALTPNEFFDIFNKYVMQKAHFKDKAFVEGRAISDHELIFEYVKNKISVGYPVAIGFDRVGSNIGHICVAYDYEGDNIIAHNLSYANKDLVISKYDTSIQLDSAYVVNSFYETHVHHNSYDIGCIDEEFDPYINHTDHIYDFSYKTNGRNKHKVYCQCGSYNISTHFVYSSQGSRIVYCLGCNQRLDRTEGIFYIVQDPYDFTYSVNNLSVLSLNEHIEKTRRGLL